MLEHQTVACVIIECPEEPFDVRGEGEGVSITRRKRIAIWRIDDLKSTREPAEMYRKLADLVPRWSNVRDVETGEPLPDPEGDPTVFTRLSFDQLTWISQALKMSPGKLPKAPGAAPTSSA